MAYSAAYNASRAHTWRTPTTSAQGDYAFRFHARSARKGAATPGGGGGFTPPPFDLNMEMPEGDALDEKLDQLEAQAALRKKQARFQFLMAGLEQGATDFDGAGAQVNTKHTCLA